MIISGAGFDECCRCSRCLCRPVDNRLSNQEKSAHWLAKFLRKFLFASSPPSYVLTGHEVDPNGTMGNNCNWSLHWLQAAEETHPPRSPITVAKTWSTRSSRMRTPYHWLDIILDWTQSRRWHFHMVRCSSASHADRWYCYPHRFRRL